MLMTVYDNEACCDESPARPSSCLSKWVRCVDNTTRGGRFVVDVVDDCKRMQFEYQPLFVAAPMVRYSKLPFRSLVRLYGADLVYTPMINANNFITSEECRSSEFTTNKYDSPTIVQFASNDPVEFAAATELVYRYCSGVDLNCGCPKRDVMRGGYGSSLLSTPERIADMIAHARRRIADTQFTISVKIRLNNDIRRTVELCRQVESAGASYICVHGRTPTQRSEPANHEAIALVKSAMRIPIIANGAIGSYQEALQVAKRTQTDGVMAANGLLDNPAMFAGHDSTPVQCVLDWLRITAEQGSAFDLFHQQLIFMLRSTLTSPQRTLFNELTSRAAVVDFLNYHLFDIK
uniref:tRNA-dihydrouridine synthase n=1 Tax=Ascaris suum TaxID=6253 RepID=F1L9M5_ASCSU